MRTTVTEQASARVLAVTGEIDIATVEALRATITDSLTQPPVPTAVVLDFSEVTYLSARGLDLLAATQRDCRAYGVPALRLIATTPIVIRALTVTDTGDYPPRYATLTDALTEPPEPY